MTFDEAKALLKPLTRREVPANVYGDAEVYWVTETTEVAFGYFAPGAASVCVRGLWWFRDDEAAALKKLGKRRAVKHGTEDA